MLTEQQIDSFASRIVRQFRPERIVLFGSYATGTAKATSDLDLLVIMPLNKRAIEKANEILIALLPPFSVDLLVRTPQEINERIALGDFFLRDVMEKGKILCEAADR